MVSDALDDTARRKQARELVDAAAALLEGDESCEEQFEALHDILDHMPRAGESREKIGTAERNLDWIEKAAQE